MDTNLAQIVVEREATLKKNKDQFVEVKSVCCKFFEKYDNQLEKVSMQNNLVMKKYEDWSKVLIEP